MADPDLTPAQFKVFGRAFDKCVDHCDIYLTALGFPDEQRSWQLLRSLAESIIVAYCVPFYASNDDAGARFSLRRDDDYFHEPELNAAHRKLLVLRAGVAHADMSVTGERYTLESAPGMDEHRYTEYVLAKREVRLIRYMADRLNGMMFTHGWLKRRDVVGNTGGNTSTHITTAEMELLDDSQWQSLAENFEDKLADIAKLNDA